jgi:predicted dehydrogenase/8-oxo-dGTP pyrophosphatase MutT (NUDIX family)
VIDEPSAEPVLLARFDTLAWANGPVEAWLGDRPPGDLPVTSACVLATAGDRLLLVDVHSRGWDLPGGHLDPGEDVGTALRRELLEEAGLAPDDMTAPVLIGWFRLTSSLMLVFRAQLDDAFGTGARPLATRVPHEIGEVRLFAPDDLPAVTSSRIWFPFLARPSELLIGVLGAGRHAVQSHIVPLRRLGHRIVVWDPDPAALDRVAAPGIERAASEDAVITGCDGLVVCSPDRFHTPTLLAAAGHGVPVLVEKPVALTEADLAAIRPLLLGRPTDPRLAVPLVSSCHPRRTDPPFAALRAALPGLVEELGPVSEVGFRFDYPPPRAGQPVLHASLLTDHVGHELDLLDFLLGVPDQVEARDVLPEGRDPMLEYQVHGRRSDAVTFDFAGRRTDPARTDYDEVLTLRLASGTVTVGSQPGSAQVSTAGRTRRLPLGGTDYDTRFREVNANFAAAVQGTADPYLSAGQIWRNTYATVELDLRRSFTLSSVVTP